MATGTMYKKCEHCGQNRPGPIPAAKRGGHPGPFICLGCLASKQRQSSTTQKKSKGSTAQKKSKSSTAQRNPKSSKARAADAAR